MSIRGAFAHSPGTVTRDRRSFRASMNIGSWRPTPAGRYVSLMTGGDCLIVYAIAATGRAIS